MRLRSCLPVLLPLVLLIGTGLWGLDFGLHWDELPWQIGPVKHMITAHTLLPGYYNYPSFDYWLNLLALAPDAALSIIKGDNLREQLLRTLDSHSFLLRLRGIYLVLTSLTLVWVYLLVRLWRNSQIEAVLAAFLLACSWEVAYHLRWVASDGILMQFAALTALLAVCSLNSRREIWIIAAAVAAGLGFGTKYPGGLLLVPVALAGIFSSVGGTLRERGIRLIKIVLIFALVYLAVTPATILQPAKLSHDVLYEMKHYATGHGGHTIQRGLPHAWRMVRYFATVFFSPYLVTALFLFALAVIGFGNFLVRRSREAIVFLSFPLIYLMYFSTQGTMVVRNLLAVAPFLAVAAARGAFVIGKSLGSEHPGAGTTGLRHVGWKHVLWAGIIVAAVVINTGWLISSAQSITAKQTDRFVRETAEYIRAHPNTKFLLSPRVKHDVATVNQSLRNVAVDAATADHFVLYAREGMHRWHDWPANRPDLTEAWFGPREVNFNIYPNWWGDDRILIMSRRRAEEIGLHIAAVSADAPMPPLPSSAPSIQQERASRAAISAEPLPTSWALPTIDPRLMVSRTEAEAVMGPIERGPASGGWELDGTACTYVNREGGIASIALISTAAYDLQRHDPRSVPTAVIDLNSYTVSAGPTTDVRLFARSLNSAVIVQLSQDSAGHGTAIEAASELGRKALMRLDQAKP
jgi:4-amino-4-deoxy-L-arabinose transferase-like glycosyltransferase